LPDLSDVPASLNLGSVSTTWIEDDVATAAMINGNIVFSIVLKKRVEMGLLMVVVVS